MLPCRYAYRITDCFPILRHWTRSPKICSKSQQGLFGRFLPKSKRCYFTLLKIKCLIATFYCNPNNLPKTYSLLFLRLHSFVQSKNKLENTKIRSKNIDNLKEFKQSPQLRCNPAPVLNPRAGHFEHFVNGRKESLKWFAWMVLEETETTNHISGVFMKITKTSSN